MLQMLLTILFVLEFSSVLIAHPCVGPISAERERKEEQFRV